MQNYEFIIHLKFSLNGANYCSSHIQTIASLFKLMIVSADLRDSEHRHTLLRVMHSAVG